MHIEPSLKSLKPRLRKEIRSRRAGIDKGQRSQWDTAINQQLSDYAGQSRPGVVAAFMAFDGEPNLMPALLELESKGAVLGLPVVQTAPGKPVITIRQWSVSDELQKNRYGIAEPVETEEIRLGDIDLILVPLVGWDRTGGRLGMGASFYDRLFQPFSELGKPVRMGVGYELQNVERIPRDPWDVRLHCVLTENGWFTCEG